MRSRIATALVKMSQMCSQKFKNDVMYLWSALVKDDIIHLSGFKLIPFVRHHCWIICKSIKLCLMFNIWNLCKDLEIICVNNVFAQKVSSISFKKRLIRNGPRWVLWDTPDRTVILLDRLETYFIWTICKITPKPSLQITSDTKSLDFFNNL